MTSKPDTHADESDFEYLQRAAAHLAMDLANTIDREQAWRIGKALNIAARAEARCETCHGTGEYLYSDTSLGSGGLAGQSMTVGRCPGTRRSALWSDCPVAKLIGERTR